jgi:tetratricopeptide (TPR) repeat protein
MFCRFPSRLGLAIALIVPLLVSTACRRTPQEREAQFLKRAKAEFDKKDYPRAIIDYKNAAQAMPKDADPYYKLGLAYLESRNLQAAVNALRKATDLNPTHAAANLKLAELMAASRNKDLILDAAERLQSIVTASPDNVEATDALAGAEVRLGRPEDATKHLEAALEKFPAHLQSSVALARLKMSRKDFAGAEEALRKAVASSPQSSPAALALGQLYMVLRQPEKAEPQIKKALELDPKSDAALMSLGAIQMVAKRLDEADKTYSRLAALPNSSYKPAHAIFQLQTGKKDAAVWELEKLTKDDPTDRTSRTLLLRTYLEMNKTAEAQALLASALKRSSKDTDALFQSSLLSLKLGNASRAEEDLKTVLRYSPDFAEGHYALANVYQATGLKKNSEQEMNEALRLNPSLLAARVTLARSFIGANQPAAAIKLLDEAPGRQKGTLAVVVTRNWALFQTGNTKEVRSTLDAALRVTRAPELVLQDAVLRMKEKDYRGACTSAEEVLRNNPEDVTAAGVLADGWAAQNQDQKALQRLVELTRARPKSAPLHNLLGQWYITTGNLVEARKEFEVTKGIDLKFIYADLALAEIDTKENQADSARQRLTAMVTADARNVRAHLMLADLELSAGNRPQAIAHYRAVLDADSANLAALNNLAYTLANDDPDQALKFAQQAAEFAPDNAAVQDTIGWVYYRKGIYTTAVDYLKRAVAKEPTARRQFHLGMSYLKAGDEFMGQKILRVALQKDPNLQKTELDWR